MERVIVNKKKRVFDGFFKIDEVEVSYQRFDGTMSKPLRRLCFERGDAVAAIIYNRQSQRTLLVKQFRYPAYEKGPGWIIETVAGMLDEGESPESAMKREVLEETGYETQKIELIATFYLSPGGSSERVHLYYVEVCDTGKVSAGGGLPSEGEDIETLMFSKEELNDLMTKGTIQDAKTIVGIQWLQMRLLSETSRGCEAAS